jgi:hypothetical protein
MRSMVMHLFLLCFRPPKKPQQSCDLSKHTEEGEGVENEDEDEDLCASSFIGVIGEVTGVSLCVLLDEGITGSQWYVSVG